MTLTNKLLTIEFWRTATVQDVQKAMSMLPTIKNDLGWTPLHWAAAFSNNPEIIVQLAEAGEDVHARDGVGDTPLHLAASSNENPSIVTALLELGASINAQDSWKLTPLHLASAYNVEQVEHILLERGADPMLTNVFGETAQEYKTYHREVAPFLPEETE